MMTIRPGRAVVASLNSLPLTMLTGRMLAGPVLSGPMLSGPVLIRPVLSAVVLTGVVLTSLVFTGVAHAQDDPFGPTWPDGEGRALTGAWCGGCHSLNLVKQQGLTRAGWDELLHWMSEKQNMPPLAGEQRDTVLDYLATSFGVNRNSGTVGADDSGLLAPLSPKQGISRPLLTIRPAEDAG